MCDTLAATGALTASGRTLFAKNSDRKAGECQPFLQYPAASYPRGSHVRCTHVEIPQVAETYRVFGHSPWWCWGFEHGVNEHAVAIGNLAVFSREPLEETPGLIGMDLVRLGLERGRTAREALEIIAALLETHGQGGPALAPDGAGYHNAFHLADPEETWILETSNRRWAARRAGLDACSNHLALERDWEIASRDLESFARTAGLWTGEGRIDVAAAYRNPHVPGHVSSGRRRRARELLESGAGTLGVPFLQRALRDHDLHGETWRPGPSPEEESYFTICAHSDPVSWTTASMVTELPADRAAPWPVWISFATPCTSVFLPVYLEGLVPPLLARDGAGPTPESAWWSFKELQDAVSVDPVRFAPAVRQQWKELELWAEAERVREEAEASGARHPHERATRLTELMERLWTAAVQRAEELRAQVETST